jgi:hypothetical protein
MERKAPSAFPSPIPAFMGGKTWNLTGCQGESKVGKQSAIIAWIGLVERMDVDGYAMRSG